MGSRESGAATAIRIVYAVFASILIIIFASNLALYATFLNDHFWQDFFKSDEVIELAIDEMDISLENMFEEAAPGANFDFDDDEVTEEFVRVVMDDYMNMIFNDQKHLDEDSFRDFFDEYEDEIFGDLDLTSREIRQIEDESIEELDQVMSDYVDDMKSSGSESGDFLEGYQDATATNKASLIVTGLIIVIGFVVTIVIHKNKFLPVRALGIAMTVAQGLNLAIWGFFTFIIKMAMEEGDDGSAIVGLMIDTLSKRLGLIMLGMLAGLILGIVLIVVGVIGAKNAAKVSDDYDGHDGTSDFCNPPSGNFGNYSGYDGLGQV